MKLHIKGKGPVTLDKNSFLASGGEGKIHVKGNKAFKLYHDPKKMIPVSKIQELSSITDPYIIKPEDIILNSRNKPVGYSMKFIKGTYEFCRLFTKAFKKRNNITTDIILQLVQKMHKGVTHVHNKNILIVDLNELNFLVDSGFSEVYFIDVDSYQTRSFPATAIMESVKDLHASKFSELSDWFSWGIVTFQLWMGIHPYKGKHQNVKDLDVRMQNNISVFNKDVSIPKLCPSLDFIPQAYRDWYKSVFEGGNRCIPPYDAQAVIVIAPIIKTIVGGNNFDISIFKEYLQDVINYVCVDNMEITFTTGGAYVYKKTDVNITPNAHVAITPKTNHIVTATIKQGKLKLYDAQKRSEIPCILVGDDVMSYNGRIYLKNGLTLLEVSFIELGGNIQVSSRLVANVMEKSTHLFDGVVLQDLLGKWFVSVFPTSGSSYQVGIDEIDGYKIVDAKFDNNVLMIIGVKKGKYDRFVIRFSSSFTSYDVRIVKDIVYSGLNFVVLENGVSTCITEEEKLELFLNKKDSSQIKVVEDNVISGDMKLLKKGTNVMFSRGNKIYNLKMKK